MQVFSPSALAKVYVAGDPPLTKIFLSEQVETLKDEFLSVKTLGTGAVEEWLKGLEERGKEKRLDADRWGKWELSGGLHQIWLLQHSASPSTPNLPSIEPSAQIESSLTSKKPSPALREPSKPGPTVNTDSGSGLRHILPQKIAGELHYILVPVKSQANSQLQMTSHSHSCSHQLNLPNNLLRKASEPCKKSWNSKQYAGPRLKGEQCCSTRPCRRMY